MESVASRNVCKQMHKIFDTFAELIAFGNEKK